MIRTALSLAAVVCLAAALPGSAVADPLTGNGGFEAGTATDSDLWSEFAGGAAGSLSERDGTNPASGSFAHRVLALGDDGLGASAGITQNSVADVGFLSLAPGSVVSGSFDADLILGPGGVAFAEFSILNGIGALVATTGPVALTDTGPGYETYNLAPLVVPGFGPAPADVYAAFLNLNVAAGAFAGASAEAFFDNVSVDGTTVVPEPTTAALVAIVGMGLAVRRRRC
ncbi:MAG: PEP-CTERM sorting domain-containing protein [Planctomycetota bacterium]